MENETHHETDKATQPERDGLNRMNDAHKNNIPRNPHDEAIDCRVYQCHKEQKQNRKKNCGSFTH